MKRRSPGEGVRDARGSGGMRAPFGRQNRLAGLTPLSREAEAEAKAEAEAEAEVSASSFRSFANGPARR